jgi:predicted transcriptional regulator
MLVSSTAPKGEHMENNNLEKFFSDLDSILSGDKATISKIIKALDSNRIISYSDPTELSLFSTTGRVLYTIILEPTITQRALSVYLGISETMVEKTVKTLAEQGLITKTKVNRKNVYTFDINLIAKNPDIQRFPEILNALLSMWKGSQQVDEESPF